MSGGEPATFALVAAGGTGGHVYPALALAHELVARGHPAPSIRFVGGTRGVEGQAVPRAGFAIDLLPGRGLQRRLTLANVEVVLQAATAAARAWRVVGRRRPRVVVGFGGYASLPTLVAARLRGRPCVVHEQNAAPGLANRIAARMGATAAVSLPGTRLPHPVLTGYPVRPEIAATTATPSWSPAVVSVVGGSLGAGRLNDAALGLAERWRDRDDVIVHHVTGPRDHDRCAERLAAARRPDDRLRYELVPYEDDIAPLWARTTVAVGRAGAGVVGEVTAIGVAAVLVPLPGAPGDHQTRNAAVLADRGAAVLLPDAECTAERLGAELDALLADPGRVAAMAGAARALAQPDALGRLADLVESLATGGPR